MRLEPAHMAAVVALALMSDDRLHIGRLTNHAACGTNAALGEGGDEFTHTEKGRFLVERQRQVDRHRLLGLEETWNPCEGDRNEALHVSGAATVDPPVGVMRAERITGPVLPIDGPRGGGNRQDDARRLQTLLVVG